MNNFFMVFLVSLTAQIQIVCIFLNYIQNSVMLTKVKIHNTDQNKINSSQLECKIRYLIKTISLIFKALICYIL